MASKSQTDKTKINTIYSDPISPIIAEMFGTSVEFDKDLGWQQTGQMGEPGVDEYGNPYTRGTKFMEPLFGRDAMSDISEYLKTPYEIGEIGQWGRENVNADTLAAAYGRYNETGSNMIDSLNEGLATGWEVDVDPIVQQALSQYYNDIVPQTVENFAGTTGVSSSGFGQGLQTGARRLATDIGAFKYAAQESAATRQAGATAQSSDLMNQYLQGQLGFGADVAGYDKYLGDLDKSTMEGAPLWDVFTSMVGQGSGTTVVEPPEIDDKAAGINAGKKIFMPGIG